MENIIKLRYTSDCRVCSEPAPAGDLAWWDRAMPRGQKVRHLLCQPAPEPVMKGPDEFHIPDTCETRFRSKLTDERRGCPSPAVKQVEYVTRDDGRYHLYVRYVCEDCYPRHLEKYQQRGAAAHISQDAKYIFA